MANGVETSREQWQRFAREVDGHARHERELAARIDEGAARQGRGRCAWVAEELGAAPARKLGELAERSKRRAEQDWDRHLENAHDAADAYGRTDEESAAGVERTARPEGR